MPKANLWQFCLKIASFGCYFLSSFITANPARNCLPALQAASAQSLTSTLNAKALTTKIDGLKITGKSGKTYTVKTDPPVSNQGKTFILYRIYDAEGKEVGYGNRGVDEANNSYYLGQIDLKDGVKDEGIAKNIYGVFSEAAPSGAGMKISSEEARTNMQLTSWLNSIDQSAGYSEALKQGPEAADAYRSERLTSRVKMAEESGETLPFWIGFLRNQGWDNFKVSIDTEDGIAIPKKFMIDAVKK